MTDAATTPSGRSLILLLVGAVGAGKGTQAERPLARARRPAPRFGQPLPRRDGGRDAARQRGAPVHGARRARARTRSTIGMFMAELAKPDDGARRRSSTAFRAPWRRRRRSTSRSRRRGSGSTASIFIDVPNEELVSRAGRPLGLPDVRHPVPRDQPSRRACPATATSRATSSCSATTIGPRSSAPASSSRCRRCSRSSTTTSAQGVVDRVDGTLPIDGVTADILDRLGAADGERTDDDAQRRCRDDQALGRDRAHGAPRERILVDILDVLRTEIRPGVTTGDLDPIAARMIADAGAGAIVPRLRQQPAVPRRHLRQHQRRGRPRHPVAAQAPRRRGRREHRHRLHRGRLARRLCADLDRRPRPARGRRARRRDPARHGGGDRRRSCRQPPRRRRPRHRVGGARARLRDRSSLRRPWHRPSHARGSAGPELRARRAPAWRSRPGCASRSSRCSRSARDDVYVADDGWTVADRRRRPSRRTSRTRSRSPPDGPRLLTERA